LINKNTQLFSSNYWTPLYVPVDDTTSTKVVTFNLPTTHRKTNGTQWRKQEMTRIKHKRSTRYTSKEIIQGMNNGSIPSAVSDTGATSTAGAVGDPFTPTNEKSTKIFSLPTGDTATATEVATLQINVRAPANRVDIVPTLTQTLLSGSKFADAGYTAVYVPKDVNFYDTGKIKITEQAVLSTITQ
jgi:hypothetical protein